MDYWWPTAWKSWGEEERAAIDRVIASDRYTQGPEVEAFEQEFATWHGVQHAIACNSGSSANLLMVATLFELGMLDYGDTVAVPAIAWGTTYAPLIQYRMDLQLLDVDDTWNAPVQEIKQAKAVLLCSILGNPAYLDQWAESDMLLLEDNCESLGAKTEWTRAGNVGFLSTTSLFWSHQLAAIEGGVVLTDDAYAARICRMLRDHGLNRGVDKASSFATEYDFQLFGYNLRLTEMHAAIAREQLKKLPGMLAARRWNWLRFRELTANLPIRLPRPNGTMSPFGVAFTLDEPLNRQRLSEQLRRNGIDCRLPTGGSFRSHTYGFPWEDQLTPHADYIHVRGMFLGCPSFQADELMARVVSVLREAIDEQG